MTILSKRGNKFLLTVEWFGFSSFDLKSNSDNNNSERFTKLKTNKHEH